MPTCRVFICQGARRYRTVVRLSFATLFLLVMLSSLLSHAPYRSFVISRTPAMFRSQLARSRPPNWVTGSANLEVNWTGRIVDTPSCQIPDFDAYNPSISPFIHDPSPHFVVCSKSLPITFTDRQYIRLNTTLTQSLGIHRCLYQQVRWLLYKIYVKNTTVFSARQHYML